MLVGSSQVGLVYLARKRYDDGESLNLSQIVCFFVCLIKLMLAFN